MVGGKRSIRLFGFSSCSLEENIALSFAWDNKDQGKKKVLFKIKWKCEYFAYFLDNGAYDDEKEVLLADGQNLLVDSVEEKFFDDAREDYTLISLRCGI